MSSIDPAPKARAFNWTIYATVAAPVIITAILVWQLSQLEPQSWCSVSTDASDKAGRPITAIQACFSLLQDMLSIYKQNTLALIVILGVSLVTIVVTTLKAGVDVSAFGSHLRIDSPEPQPVVVKNDDTQPIPVDQQHQEPKP